MSRSRILVIGGTGTMGQHLARASLAAGHPTVLLVRPPATAAADPSKLKLLEALKESGATIVDGDMNDQESLVAAIKQADVVISAVGHQHQGQLNIVAAINQAGNVKGDLYEHESLVSALKQQADVVISAVGHRGPHDLEDGQLRIVAAIKEAGNIKRFLASEYGCDVEQAAARSEAVVEPARSILVAKARIRQAVRAAGIPHTFLCSYWAHGFVLPRLGDPHVDGPPEKAATVFGDDSTRAIFVDEADMSAVAIRAVDDPRALNKILYVRPAVNTCSFSHLVGLWEQKTGRALERRYVAEEELLRMISESPPPLNLQLAMVHATVGAAACCDQVVDASTGVEATDLYPDFNYVTVKDYLDGLLIAQGN